MRLSMHSLHASVLDSPKDAAGIRAQLQSIAHKRRTLVGPSAPRATEATIAIPLTVVSKDCNFDACINIRFQGQPTGALTWLIVDSGNSTLIVPSWDDIKGLPAYTTLGDAPDGEPFGCPAKVVQGPIEIPTTDGSVYTIENCVFYACTAPGPNGITRNFGAGCVVPWSASGWNTPLDAGPTLQAPLSYNIQYPYADIAYAPAAAAVQCDGTAMVAEGSSIVLSQTPPEGYAMLDITPGLPWMSLVPKSLSIAGNLTEWPGIVRSPLAMIDTGGGPVFLNDPNGYLYSKAWQQPPMSCSTTWTSGSKDCNCISVAIAFELENASKTTSYKLTIDPSILPSTAQGLTLVMCRINEFMMCQQGMNIGGINALFYHILIDYLTGQVGFKPK